MILAIIMSIALINIRHEYVTSPVCLDSSFIDRYIYKYDNNPHYDHEYVAVAREERMLVYQLMECLAELLRVIFKLFDLDVATSNVLHCLVVPHWHGVGRHLQVQIVKE